VAGQASRLPDELNGILPIPDPENPTIVVEDSSGQFGWALLARIAAAMPVAIGRPSLIDHFRLAFIALEREMRNAGDLLDAPTEEILAAALGRRPQRIRELL